MSKIMKSERSILCNFLLHQAGSRRTQNHNSQRSLRETLGKSHATEAHLHVLLGTHLSLELSLTHAGARLPQILRRPTSARIPYALHKSNETLPRFVHPISRLYFPRSITDLNRPHTCLSRSMSHIAFVPGALGRRQDYHTGNWCSKYM